LLAQVIAALWECQFELHKIDANQIDQSFNGATFVRAHEAFYKERIDFFQNRDRPDRAKAVSKQMKMIQAGGDDKNRQHRSQKGHRTSDGKNE
jgi:hypothetical protein